MTLSPLSPYAPYYTLLLLRIEYSLTSLFCRGSPLHRLEFNIVFLYRAIHVRGFCCLRPFFDLSYNSKDLIALLVVGEFLWLTSYPFQLPNQPQDI